MNTLHMIAYISDFKSPDQTDEKAIYKAIEDVVNHAKEENPKHGITGVLFCLNNQFMQVIEGRQEKLDQLMKT